MLLVNKFLSFPSFLAAVCVNKYRSEHRIMVRRTIAVQEEVIRFETCTSRVQHFCIFSR